MPNRIVHLVDGFDPACRPVALRLIARLVREAPDEHRVFFFGPADDAEACALPVARHLDFRPGLGPRTWRALRRDLQRRGPDEIIHCWSAKMLLVATILARHTPRLLNVFGPVDATWPAGRLRRALHRSPAALLAGNRLLADDLRRAGMPARHVHVLPPAVEPPPDAIRHRPALRERWGVDDQTLLVAHLADPPERCDALMGMWAAGLVIESGRPLKLLLPREARHLRRTRDLVGRSGRDMLVVSEALHRAWEALAACDAAMCLVGGKPRTAEDATPRTGADATAGPGLAHALAAGLPIIAERHTAAGAVLTHEQNALLGRPSVPREQARHLCRLIDEPALGDRLGRGARELAARRFGFDRHLAALRAVYEALAGGERVGAR